MTGRSMLATLSFALLVSTANAQQPAADLVVTNAKIYTVDDAHPRAQAMVIKDGKVIFVGDNRGARTFIGSNTQQMDLDGKTVIPGMVDAHGHLANLGQRLKGVDLVGTKSYDEVIQRVVERAKVTPAGQWIRGRGWDQNDWADTRFPSNEALSKAVPNHPVYLTRVDGHAGLVNARAIQLAGVTAATKDPDGGRFIRDAAGNPTGVLIDAAQGIVSSKIPAVTPQEVREFTVAAISELNKWGLTGLHDAGENAATVQVFTQLVKEGKYNLRNYVMLRDQDSIMDRFMAQPPIVGMEGRLWVHSIKLYIDGALGSRGAALLEPYTDDPTNVGLLVARPEDIRRVAVKALKAGWQVNTHAIGDRGNRIVLDEFEKALKEVPKADHRFRVEHAQILHWDDIPRFAQLGVIPSMQGSHATSDMYWAVNRLGPTRALGAYPWRSLLNSGVVIPNGSDFPVESANPLISFHSFVTRQDENNWPTAGWYPEQRTTREEALLSMTMWPAYSAFMEKESGSLTPGKFGDFVVLDQDIMTIPSEQILNTRVEMTVLGGKVVYRRETPRT